MQELIRQGLARIQQEERDAHQQPAPLDPEEGVGPNVFPVFLSTEQMRLVAEVLQTLPQGGLSQQEKDTLIQLGYQFTHPLYLLSERETEAELPCPETLLAAQVRAACSGDTFS